jgi:hypothetical protein
MALFCVVALGKSSIAARSVSLSHQILSRLFLMGSGPLEDKDGDGNTRITPSRPRCANGGDLAIIPSLLRSLDYI